MRRSLLDSGNKESAITSILPTLSSSIRECEEARVSQDDVGTPHKDLGVPIGPLVRKAQSTGSVDEPSTTVSQNYLKALIDLDGESYTSPKDYLKRNPYLLWEIPEEAHRMRLEQQGTVLNNIIVRGDPGEEMQQQARRVSELITMLLEVLQGISEENWTGPGIKTTIAPFAESIACLRDDKPDRIWGWKLLRLAVSVSPVGPSIVPTIAFLGKEETLARMSQACQVAQRMEA